MKVLLDACVLYPTVLREILIGVARAGLFQPLWSDRILEEWARATAKLGPGAQEVARGEIALLRREWPGASVVPRGGDLARLWLPDPDDIHVLGAAIAGSADILLTLNAKDFPRQTLWEEGLVRRDPDQFLRALLDDAPGPVAAAARDTHAVAERLSGRSIEFRDLMKRARLPRLGKAILADTR